MFRASLCPSSGEQECALPHMAFCTGYRCVELRHELCALWTVTFTVHTARVPAPHNHSQYNQCRTPYAAVHTLVLLMMGIMMPETCWDRSLKIIIRLVASCWFLCLHPMFIYLFIYIHSFIHLFMMHSHKSLKKMDIHLSSCIIFINLRILLQRLTVFSYKTCHFQYIYIYKEANIRILNFLTL